MDFLISGGITAQPGWGRYHTFGPRVFLRVRI
jgi:hypothetical protein